MKITSLELENVKRVKAVEIAPAQNGLTVIGGRNGQGKTSILDAIAWALGGEKFRPSSAQRDDSVIPPRLHVVLDNGIVVERDGKNSTLKVTDPSGKRAGQALLDEFVEKLALDLPKFMQQTNKEKATTLLRVIGMEDQVRRLDDQEQQLYNRRHALGQIVDQKMKYAKELVSFPGVPDVPVSASELIERQQHILLRNAENQRKRQRASELASQLDFQSKEVQRLQTLLGEAMLKENQLKTDLSIAQTDAATLQDESTANLEESIRNIEDINQKVRANLDKEKAQNDANDLAQQYDGMTAQIEAIREQRMALLKGANLPLAGLSVENGELQFNGKAWDCMSSSDQLRVAVAIVRAINPQCQFVLVDKTEQMDPQTLTEFGEWLEHERIQAICTRVGTDGVCQIIIEDGTVVSDNMPKQTIPQSDSWLTQWKKKGDS